MKPKATSGVAGVSEAGEVNFKSHKFRNLPLEERFWSRIEKRGEHECWLWIGAKDLHGYGSIGSNGKRLRAHRLSWEIYHKAEFPKDLHACHSCDNPTCVNPKHIWPGTRSENIKDSFRKGRSVSPVTAMGPWNRNISHCKRGHPLSGENVRVNKAGSRMCLACMNLKSKERWKKIKEQRGLSPGGKNVYETTN